MVQTLVAVIVLVVAFAQSYQPNKILTKSRNMIRIPPSPNGLPKPHPPITIRILQFNILADGLSGRRSDLGDFSRANKDVLDWDIRKEKLLYEITQYDPDIITLQEIDHYHDYFLPKLRALGYVGYFAPKPTSKCLAVSEYSDGCALFVRRSRLKVVSCETRTLALSIAGVEEGELLEESKAIQTQNQVGMMALCEFIVDDDGRDIRSQSESQNGSTSYPKPPPLIVSTTHLKSAKTGLGERYRQKAALQFLDMIDSLYCSLTNAGRAPVVLFTGDLNACPENTWYSAPLTYRAIRGHRLALRSVYNQDVGEGANSPLSSEDLYTTWKARRAKGGSVPGEKVIKRCIDYIFYCPYEKKSNKYLAWVSRARSIVSKNGPTVAIPNQEFKVNGLFGRNWTTSIAALLGVKNAPSQSYLFPWDSGSNADLIARDSGNGAQRGKLLSAVDNVPNRRDGTNANAVFFAIVLRALIYGGISLLTSLLAVSSAEPGEKAASVALSGAILLMLEVLTDVFDAPFYKPNITPKLSAEIEMELTPGREKPFAFFKNYVTLNGKKYLQRPLSQDGRPGLKPIAALDLFTETQIGKDYIPSANYPSDHIAIAADFAVIWDPDEMNDDTLDHQDEEDHYQ